MMRNLKHLVRKMPGVTGNEWGSQRSWAWGSCLSGQCDMRSAPGATSTPGFTTRFSELIVLIRACQMGASTLVLRVERMKIKSIGFC